MQLFICKNKMKSSLEDLKLCLQIQHEVATHLCFSTRVTQIILGLNPDSVKVNSIHILFLA